MPSAETVALLVLLMEAARKEPAADEAGFQYEFQYVYAWMPDKEPHRTLTVEDLSTMIKRCALRGCPQADLVAIMNQVHALRQEGGWSDEEYLATLIDVFDQTPPGEPA